MTHTPFINDRGEEELPYVDGTRSTSTKAEEDELQAHEARLAGQRALLEAKILEMTRCGIDIAHRDEFEAALAMWRESASLAAKDLGNADNAENVLLLRSEEKSAERRKAEAELGSQGMRLIARLSAIGAEADKQRVLYLVNRARQGAT